MFCPKCHSEIEDDALFCPECGNRLESQEPPQVREGYHTQELYAEQDIQEPYYSQNTQEQYQQQDAQNLYPNNTHKEYRENVRMQEGPHMQNTNPGQFYGQPMDTEIPQGNGGKKDNRRNTSENPNNKRVLFMGLSAAAVILLVAAAVIITNVILNKKDEQKAEKEALLADVTAGTDEDADTLQEDVRTGTDDQQETDMDAEDAEKADAAVDSQTDEGTDEADLDADESSDSENAESTPIPTAQPLDLGPDPSSITAELLKKAPKDSVRLEVATASSSSELVQEGSDPNNAWMVLDEKDETSWQENVSGPGIGETLNFSFSGEQKVKYMSFKLGNWRNDKYYKGNNIPETLKICMGELEFSVTFPKKQQEFWVELSEAFPTYDVQVEIVSVYKGTSWDDTPIAEIGMYGEK